MRKQTLAILCMILIFILMSSLAACGSRRLQSAENSGQLSITPATSGKVQTDEIHEPPVTQMEESFGSSTFDDSQIVGESTVGCLIEETSANKDLEMPEIEIPAESEVSSQTVQETPEVSTEKVLPQPSETAANEEKNESNVSATEDQQESSIFTSGEADDDICLPELP